MKHTTENNQKKLLNILKTMKTKKFELKTERRDYGSERRKSFLEEEKTNEQKKQRVCLTPNKFDFLEQIYMMHIVIMISFNKRIQYTKMLVL